MIGLYIKDENPLHEDNSPLRGREYVSDDNTVLMRHFVNSNNKHEQLTNHWQER